MAAKYQLITELYRRTGVAVAKNPQAWQGLVKHDHHVAYQKQQLFT